MTTKNAPKYFSKLQDSSGTVQSENDGEWMATVLLLLAVLQVLIFSFFFFN